jgi:2-haloalkanoic acid dehalogenase type II
MAWRFSILDPSLRWQSSFSPAKARRSLQPGGVDSSTTRGFAQWLAATSIFLQVTDEALSFATDAEKIVVTTEQRQQLMAGFMNLKAWPDVVPMLKALKKQGLGLAPLTDFTVPMLEVAIRNSDLGGVFDHLLSTDLVKAYKPDPRSYQMGLNAFGLLREQIAFVAFGGWDAAGAKTFGFPTIWINRLNTPTERLGVLPDKIASTLSAARVCRRVGPPMVSNARRSSGAVAALAWAEAAVGAGNENRIYRAGATNPSDS